MNQFKREPRYIVLKIKDLEAYCSEQTREAAMSIGDIIANGRRRAGKAPFNALVVEQDWPEFEPTWAAIEARMTGQPIDPVVAVRLRLRKLEGHVAELRSALELLCPNECPFCTPPVAVCVGHRALAHTQNWKG